MVLLDELVELLRVALHVRSRREECVKRFQEIVWDHDDFGCDPETERILRDLAYDIDFFEPDVRLRKGDPSYYGDVRFEAEVATALEKLRKACVIS